MTPAHDTNSTPLGFKPRKVVRTEEGPLSPVLDYHEPVDGPRPRDRPRQFTPNQTIVVNLHTPQKGPVGLRSRTRGPTRLREEGGGVGEGRG